MQIKVIRLGSHGPIVRAIQAFLRGQGFAVLTDGNFGKNTEKAVVAYQKKNRLAQDGEVGNATLTVMMGQGLKLVDNVPTGDKSRESPVRPPFSPLTSNNARAVVFGKFNWTHTPTKSNPEAITVSGDWVQKNIVRIIIPQLVTLGLSKTGYVTCHRKVAYQLTNLWAAWEKAGLLNKVLTYEGTYVARLVRGSKSSLSNHAFGSAFDVNYAWNLLGTTPALSGVKGSVRELVAIAHEWGFYWGGHFSRGDGMHFEVAVVLEEGTKLFIDYVKNSYRMIETPFSTMLIVSSQTTVRK
jgi:peptidoglycan hydrolase-like protein with peptidoglycan-binding domain